MILDARGRHSHGGTPVITDADDERCRVAYHWSQRAGDGVVTGTGEVTLVLPRDLYQIAASCTAFDTPAGHAARWARHHPGASTEVIAGHLATLRDAGWLESVGSLRGALARPAASEPAPMTLGILACDRPELAARAVRSWMGLVGDTDLPCVVSDDSSDPAAASAVRAAVSAVAPRVRYLGPVEKDALAARVASASGVSPSIVRFAVLGDDASGLTFRAGASRNALLLATAGRRLVMADDDVVADFSAPPDPMDGACAVNGDPTEFWFHDDHAALVRSRVPARDPLSWCDVLGQPPGLRVDGDVSFERATPHLTSILRRPTARVVALSYGLAGDSAMGSARYLYFLQGASRERFLDVLGAGPPGRELVRVAPRLSLTRGGALMSYTLGLDNAGLLPPYFPVTRGEDDTFVFLLERCLPDGVAAHVPAAVLHEPAVRRVYGAPDVDGTPSYVPLQEVVRWCVNDAAVLRDHLGPAARMELTGAWLRQLAASPPRAFQDFLIACRRARNAGWLEQQTRAASRPGQPQRWVDAVGDGIRSLGASLTDAAPVHVDGLGSGRDGEAGTLALQGVIGRYGALLEVWPRLWAAARDLGGHS